MFTGPTEGGVQAGDKGARHLLCLVHVHSTIDSFTSSRKIKPRIFPVMFSWESMELCKRDHVPMLNIFAIMLSVRSLWRCN